MRKEGPTTKAHKDRAPKAARVAVVTLSDSRNIADDESGKLIGDLLRQVGHTVVSHTVIPDEGAQLVRAVDGAKRAGGCDAIITTGGTGIGPRDITVETLRPMFETELTAFGTLFATLSYAEIGSAALLSRATAGIIGRTVVFCLPGSPGACRLALERLILPELGHIVHHMNK
ncbi:molybdenum cofactor biosynthesis protein MoaB [Candidatus Woesearchaeota archaeon]|nr:molybdenum cofactor biosynthesis protein MoaB [Candidatus Woesearchaeota archaeon]